MTGLLEFDGYNDYDPRRPLRVYINAQDVASVQEKDARPSGALVHVAVIHLRTGQTHTVLDYGRTAVKRIERARQEE
jgi:hypothetical protein